MRMAKNSGEELRVEGVPQEGDKGEKEEKGKIEDEKDYREYFKPVSVVRQLME